MDKELREMKRGLKRCEFVERWWEAREDKEVTVAEYTDFNRQLRKFDHISEFDGIEF